MPIEVINCIPYILTDIKHVGCQEVSAVISQNIGISQTKSIVAVESL